KGQRLSDKDFTQGPVSKVAVFSPDSRWICTGADLQAGPNRWAVSVGDVATGALVSPLLIHRGAVRDVAFSPDGTRLVTASNDGTAQVWDLPGGTPAGPALLHGAPVSLVRFSPDGRWVATACEDAGVRVWDALTSQAITPPLRHGGRI